MALEKNIKNVSFKLMSRTHMEPISQQFHMVFLLSEDLAEPSWEFGWPQNIWNMIWDICPAYFVLVLSQ